MREGAEVSGDVLVALAQFAGQTVAAAAVTDVWEAVRGGSPGCWGAGMPGRLRSRSGGWRRPASSCAAARARTGAGAGGAAERWAGRFADLLDEDPGLEAELRALVEEVAARLPAGAVSAAGHSVAAGRDVNITASGGGIAAGVIHGDVAPPGPTRPGPAKP